MSHRINQGHGLRLTSEGGFVDLTKENMKNGKANSDHDFVAVDCETDELLDKYWRPKLDMTNPAHVTA